MFEEMARRPGAAEADEGYEGQGFMGRHTLPTVEP